jgi:hypothetical protein
MNINRNSWHYKLNSHVFNDSWGMKRWERTHNTFCSYWRATVFRLIFTALATALVLAMLTVMVVAVYANPVGAGITAIGIVGLLVVVIGGALLTEVVSEKLSEEPKTLVGKQIMVYKSKICPKVDYNG